jgi:hypothetical protein
MYRRGKKGVEGGLPCHFGGCFFPREFPVDRTRFQDLFVSPNTGFKLAFSVFRQEVEVESTETAQTTPDIKEKTVEEVKAQKEEVRSRYYKMPFFQ